jgi:2-keto-4-pentenoate hydratase/2-oxohepta-3-ene-1,7-dioic acid hydratase in catechol pathway
MHLYQFDEMRLGAGSGDGSLVDITGLVDPNLHPLGRMQALVDTWEDVRPKAERALVSRSATPVTDVVLRAPLPAPRNVIAAPVNYRRHQQEMGGTDGVYSGETIHTIETYAGFVKASSSVIGPDEPICLPVSNRRFDHEAEIGVVIGRQARGVGRDGALGYIFGLVPLLDITMRGPEDRSFRKSFDTFTPIGPAIVTLDEIDDPTDIAFQLTVNGELRQHGNSRDLIYGLARLVELYSGVITLEAGDLIASGTPEGVGEIRPGDAIALTIEGIGQLAMGVTAAPRLTVDVQV